MRGPRFDRNKRSKTAGKEERNGSVRQKGQDPVDEVRRNFVFVHFGCEEVGKNIIETPINVEK